MNNLDLNAYGVQEMNHQEMVETNGGWIVTGLIILGIALLASGCTIVIGDNNNINTQVDVEADVDAEVQV
ncbi:MAG: class IIb bacteriocin, lactobin A/cerein 7B family [Bacteroidales bacterium]|nr:class IIb bacteriocin, lactobin A/cerein 7B family [Bacteroidales bacterium]